jgi:hypothetical protein
MRAGLGNDRAPIRMTDQHDRTDAGIVTVDETAVHQNDRVDPLGPRNCLCRLRICWKLMCGRIEFTMRHRTLTGGAT